MEEAVVTAMKSLPGVTGIVEDRIVWREADSRWARPYIVLHHVSDESFESNDGPTGLNTANIQVNCVADTFGQATKLRRAVQQWFGNYSGTHNGSTIRVILRQSRNTVSETVSSGKPGTVCVQMAEYLVSYTEEVSVSYS